MKITYKIEIAPFAQRQLKKMTKQLQALAIKKLEQLQHTPRPEGVKKLTGMDNLYRIRIGDYRIIYKINDQELIILVVKIGDRKDIYR